MYRVVEPANVIGRFTSHQVGTLRARPFQHRFYSPLVDGLVVTAEEHFGNFPAAPLARAGVMRTVEQPLSIGCPARKLSHGEGILRRRFIVAEHARDESHHGIDEHHRGQLATTEHVIADAQLKGLQFVDDALVNPFIMPGDQKKPGLFRQVLDPALIQRASLWTEQDTSDWTIIFFLNRDDCVIQRLAHHDHPWSAAKRSIIDLGVLVVGPVANVVEVILDKIRLSCSTQNACVQYARKHIREEGENIDPHGVIPSAA